MSFTKQIAFFKRKGDIHVPYPLKMWVLLQYKGPKLNSTKLSLFISLFLK